MYLLSAVLLLNPRVLADDADADADAHADADPEAWAEEVGDVKLSVASYEA